MTIHKLLVELTIGVKLFAGGISQEPLLFIPFYILVMSMVLLGQKRCLHALVKLRKLLLAVVGYIVLAGYDFNYRGNLVWVGFMYVYDLIVVVDILRTTIGRAEEATISASRRL